jgi:integrase/recombinase XerD
LPRKSSEWLFPGNRWHSSGQPIDTKTPRNACKQAAQRAGFCSLSDSEKKTKH